jgi:tetratricopeptide (TPR) repeat protein
VALCRQADILARLQRYDAAIAAYTTVLQRWPDDQHARLRLALLTILQQPAPEAAELDRLLADALTLACTDVSNLPEPLTPQVALQWLQQASPYDPRVADIADILTLYGEVALQRQDFSTTITLLTPVHAIAPQPRQAYALAGAHYAHSTQATSDDERFQDSERALAYVQAAVVGETPLSQATTLLSQIQEQHESLLAARQREERLLAYYDDICDFFTRYNVPFHDEIGTQPPDAPWLELREAVDLDEQSGELVTTIWLGFNHNAATLEPHPSEQDVALYAQHQRDAQLLVSIYGMDALPWPQTPYEGQTAFAVVFPERLALNRDLLFVAFADLHALLRYARVLQHMVLRLPLPQTEAETPRVESLATAARYMTILPVLSQRLRTLATTASAKAVQRQVTESQAALTMPPTLRHLRTFPAFVEAYTYFQTLVEALLPHLDMPPQERTSERPGNQHEERPPRRPAQRKRRQRPPKRLLADQGDV